MARQRTDLVTLWRNIEHAGGIDAYVNGQLREHGYIVERKDPADMSKRQLAQYKLQLRKEAEEIRRLKREAWAAYKSSHISHLGEGIYWNDFDDSDKWDIENAEERAAENQLPPIDNPAQLATLLGLSIAEVRWLAWHREAATNIHYRRFTIPKSDGTERAIWAPLPKLKEAQWWILRNIVEKLPVHGSAHGFLPGRSTLSNARPHRQSQIVVQMDIRNFFPTVVLPRVKGVFRKAGYREQIATLLALICTESPREIVEHDGTTYYIAMGQRCLPQGAPTSPALTNTLSMRMDRRLRGIARKYGWRYTRYADDLTFSLPLTHQGPPHTGALMGLVKRIVADEGFQIHSGKTRVSRKGSRQKVTGLVVNGDGPARVPRMLKRQIRAAIHNLSQGKPLRDGESITTLSGYIAYIQMCEPALGKQMELELSAAVNG